MKNTKKTLLQKLKDLRRQGMLSKSLSRYERAELDDIIAEIEGKEKSANRLFDKKNYVENLLKQRKSEYLNLSVNNNQRIRNEYLEQLNAINRINSMAGVGQNWTQKEQMLRLKIIEALKKLNPNEYTDKVQKFKNSRDFSIVDVVEKLMDKKVKNEIGGKEIRKGIILFFD